MWKMVQKIKHAVYVERRTLIGSKKKKGKNNEETGERKRLNKGTGTRKRQEKGSPLGKEEYVNRIEINNKSQRREENGKRKSIYVI